MKLLFLSVLLVFNLVACASAHNPLQKEFIIHPGEIRWVEIESNDELVKLFCKGVEIKTHKEGNKWQAVVIESYFSDLQPFICDFKIKDRVIATYNFKVVARDYPSEKLRVDTKKIKLSPKDQERADREQVMLNKIYQSSLASLQFKQPFIRPMNSAITSFYGTRRVYNGMKKGQHLGVDYRAAIGDVVPVANSGLVVFAGDLFYTGGTVIVDHGLDIFTVYGHLSKVSVESGQRIERGSVIGYSGNTGRTSGPHLHWGVKIQGQYVDGMVLIIETEKSIGNNLVISKE